MTGVQTCALPISIEDPIEFVHRNKNCTIVHREVGIHAVRKGIDVLICIGSLMKSAADGALEYLEQQKNAEHTEETPSSSAHFPTQICHFATKADFLREAKELLKEGDTVLVKASHGMEFPEIVEFLQQ